MPLIPSSPPEKVYVPGFGRLVLGVVGNVAVASFDNPFGPNTVEASTAPGIGVPGCLIIKLSHVSDSDPYCNAILKVPDLVPAVTTAFMTFAQVPFVAANNVMTVPGVC